MFKIKSFKQYISEDVHNTLIIVDVQPAYKQFINFDMFSFIDHINSFYNIEVFYNGEDLGMDSIYDIQEFYIEYGLEEDVLNNMNFFEKNYGFFRDLIDYGIDDDDIVKIGKFMLGKKIYDWRDLDDQDYETFCKVEDIEILNRDDFSFNLPDVLVYISKLSDNCILIGGGEDECLKEVELCFQILDKSYSVNSKFVY